jgi:prepilin signal peptidase PulO-like enzyme (type II secretory pathway)
MASGSVVAVCALLGLVVGWFAVVPVIERFPDPSSLTTTGRVAGTVANAIAWALVARKIEPLEGWGFVVPTLAFVSVLVAVSVIDLRVYRIPDRVVFPSLAVLVPAVALGGSYELGWTDGFLQARNAVIGMTLYFVALFLPHLVYPKGMGFGDVKLGLLMGLFLGWYTDSLWDVVYFVLIAIMVGCVLGVVMGIVVNLSRRRGGAFPFGPALAAGALYVVLNFDRFLTNL